MIVMIVVGVLGIVAVAGIALYNRLVHLRARADEAWAQVDTQLQRRHDLVPNLVATVGAYAGHERGAMSAVTRARLVALRTDDPAHRADAEDALGDALERLLVVAEGYPELAATERFRHLQVELADTEDRLAFAREFANHRVARYRTAIRSFPGVLLAEPLGFVDRVMFDADPSAQRAPTTDVEG